MTIIDYQEKCFKNYKNTIGYPTEYTYLKGNPINVLVPIETTLNNLMIVGAYPLAKFYTFHGISDTPMADNDNEKIDLKHEKYSYNEYTALTN